jgi:hypothetical protein
MVPPKTWGVVLARQHRVGTGDQRSEEAVEFFEVHCLAALAPAKKIAQSIQLGISQRLVLRKRLHS